MMTVLSTRLKNYGLTLSVVMLIVFSGMPVSAQTLLIRNAHIISGEAPKVSKLQDVLINNGKIQAIGRQLGKADQVIDAKGKYLIPGLIDSHVHLDGIPGYVANKDQDQDQSKTQSMLQTAREQMPHSYVYFGFTTVLDLTGDVQFIGKWNKNPMSPQAYFCAPVTIPNGYPAVWIGKEEQFKVKGSQYMLFDEAQKETYPETFKPEAHTPEVVVQLAKNEGANCIKVFYETGFGPQKNLPVPSLGLIQAVVKQAHQLDMSVYLHGNSQAAYEFATKSGIDTLVHGMWHENKITNQDEHADEKMTKEQIAQTILKKGISIQPTIQVLYGEQEQLNPDFFKNPLVQHAIPADLAVWYQSEAGQWMKNILAQEIDPALTTPAEKYQAIKTMYEKPLNTVNNMTKRLHQGGTSILFGSDTPSGPFYTQFPGVNGRWEMDRWAEAGIELPYLFSALTIRNAKALGLEKSIGSVEVGKRADLLLLTANPLEKLAAYDMIETIILKGKIYPRKIFSAQ